MWRSDLPTSPHDAARPTHSIREHHQFVHYLQLAAVETAEAVGSGAFAADAVYHYTHVSAGRSTGAVAGCSLDGLQDVELGGGLRSIAGVAAAYGNPRSFA